MQEAADRVAENGNLNANGEACEPFVNIEKFEDGSETENTIPRRGRINSEFKVQVLLSLLLFFAAASSGMAMGYPAVLLPQLKLVNGSLHTDEEMGSWIASIFPAFTPVGSLISGVMIHYYGRLLTLKVQTVVAAVSWIFVVFCNNHTILLIGRLIAGAASGLGVVAGQVYVAEVSNPKSRAVICSVPFLSHAFGILLVYALGSALHWRLVAGLSIILPVVSACMYFIFPESPVWLVRQGQTEKAKKAAIWFRGNNIAKATVEIQQLISRVKDEKAQQQEDESTWKSFCTPQVLKPFIISNLFNLLQTLTGIYLIVFYAVDIISDFGGTNVNETFAAVLSAGVRLVFTIVGCFLLVFMGRRTLALCSSLGTGISALILGTFLYSRDVSNGYFAATCLLIYVAANTVGLLLLPAIMMGELFPAKARSFAGSLTYTIFSLFTFGIAKLFPLLKQHLRMHGMFWLFGISSFLLSVLVYLVLPETKNKTLNDIEDYFLQKHVLWMSRNKKPKHRNIVNNTNNNI